MVIMALRLLTALGLKLNNLEKKEMQVQLISSDKKTRLEGLINKARSEFERLGVRECVNQAGISGGKDSTAIYLLAYELGIKIIPTYCDTDNEHDITNAHVRTFYKSLPNAPEVLILKKEYSEAQFEKKRDTIRKNWRKPHRIRAGSRRGEFIPPMSEESIEKALNAVQKTGNSFLDMCLLHGMFPLRRSQFCTDELKIDLVYDEVLKPLLAQNKKVLSWSGVRRDESKKRQGYEIISDDNRNPNLKRFSPILDWTAEDVFEMHKRWGVEPNPLYKQGMKRVGCMPCINCNKDELNQISKRFPEYIEKIYQWETLITDASRWSSNEGVRNNFLCTGASFKKGPEVSVYDAVKWSQTKRGGKEIDEEKAAEDVEACSSVYGLCE